MSAEEEAVERGTGLLMAWFLHEDHELTCRDLVEELFAIARAQSPTETAEESAWPELRSAYDLLAPEDRKALMRELREMALKRHRALAGEFGNTQTRENSDG